MRLKVYFFLMVTLAVSSALSLPTVEVEIVDIDENDTIEGDLTLDDICESPNIHRSSILPGNRLWTSPISYVLDRSLDLNAKGVIMRAFDQLRVKSCIDFKPHESEDYYLNIKKLDGISSTTITSPPTTTDFSTSSTTHPPTTTDYSTSSTTHPPNTTDYRISSTTITPPPSTTDVSISSTTHPANTTDYSPGMVASPVLTVLLALIYLLL